MWKSLRAFGPRMIWKMNSLSGKTSLFATGGRKSCGLSVIQRMRCRGSIAAMAGLLRSTRAGANIAAYAPRILRHAAASARLRSRPYDGGGPRAARHARGAPLRGGVDRGALYTGVGEHPRA